MWNLHIFSNFTSRNKRKTLKRSQQLVFDLSDVCLVCSLLYYQLARSNALHQNLTKPSDRTSSMKLVQTRAKGKDKLLKGTKETMSPRCMAAVTTECLYTRPA